MKEKYESLSVGILKELAKARGMKHVSAMKKSEVVEAMLALDEKEEQERKEALKRKNLQEKKPAERTGAENGKEHEHPAPERERTAGGAASSGQGRYHGRNTERSTERNT